MNRKWERFGNHATSRRTEQFCVAFPRERSVAWPFSGRQMLRRFFALFGKARTPDRFEAARPPAPHRQSHPASASVTPGLACIGKPIQSESGVGWSSSSAQGREEEQGESAGEQFVMAADCWQLRPLLLRYRRYRLKVINHM